MRQIEGARKRYEEIPILAKLSGWAKAATAWSEEKRKSQRQRMPTVRIRRKHRMWGTCAGMAAALVLVFTVALGTNAAFTEVVAGLPVMGAAARILIFRPYEKDEGDWKMSVEIPSVEMIARDTDGLGSVLNQEVYGLCNQYADGAVERAREYKKVFMETGETEEEWEAHDINIHVECEIEAWAEAYLSFAVQGAENWSSVHGETKYYNVDLKGNRVATLADVLGHDYAEIADGNALRQVENMEEKGGTTFWPESEDGFIGVMGKTVFYMSEKGGPVIVSDKYETAPGAHGRLEFKIDKAGNIAEKTDYTGDSIVSGEEVTVFAGRVKKAIADQDMDALAPLASYPLYVGFKDGGASTGSPERLAALGTDRIFTPGLATAVEAAGDETLSPGAAGFVLRKGGTPNIVFGVPGGVLAIKRINY